MGIIFNNQSDYLYTAGFLSENSIDCISFFYKPYPASFNGVAKILGTSSFQYQVYCVDAEPTAMIVDQTEVLDNSMRFDNSEWSHVIVVVRQTSSRNKDIYRMIDIYNDFYGGNKIRNQGLGTPQNLPFYVGSAGISPAEGMIGELEDLRIWKGYSGSVGINEATRNLRAVWPSLGTMYNSLELRHWWPLNSGIPGNPVTFEYDRVGGLNLDLVNGNPIYGEHLFPYTTKTLSN